MDVDIPKIAGEVASVDEKIIQVLPFILGAAGFVPGGSVVAAFSPVIMEALTALDNAAKLIAADNPTAAFKSVLDALTAHLTPGKPNSPALS